MIVSATGIILRTRPLTETSLIIQWLTPEFGRISTVAKGARRPKSPFAGKLDLFYLAEFSFSRSRHSDLHALREVSLRETHRKLRSELGLLQHASYCAALVQQATETETPLPAMYELMRRLLDQLAQHPPQPHTIFTFEVKLLAELGQQPDVSRTSLTPGTRRIMEKLATTDWTELSGLKLSAAQTTEMRQFLHDFLIFHLGKIPGGRTV